MFENWGCGLYMSAAYTRVFTVINPASQSTNNTLNKYKYHVSSPLPNGTKGYKPWQVSILGKETLDNKSLFTYFSVWYLYFCLSFVF